MLEGKQAVPRFYPGRRRLLRHLKDCLTIATANLLQQRLRLLVAVAGTAMPILLLLLQLALVRARAQGSDAALSLL